MEESQTSELLVSSDKAYHELMRNILHLMNKGGGIFNNNWN